MDFRDKKLIPVTKQQLENASSPPADTYRFRVDGAAVAPARSGSGDTLRLQLGITDGEYQGREVVVVFSFAVLEPIQKLFAALGLLSGDAERFSTDDLVGRSLVAELEFDEVDGGRRFARLRDPRAVA